MFGYSVRELLGARMRIGVGMGLPVGHPGEEVMPVLAQRPAFELALRQAPVERLDGKPGHAQARNGDELADLGMVDLARVAGMEEAALPAERGAGAASLHGNKHADPAHIDR